MRRHNATIAGQPAILRFRNIDEFLDFLAHVSAGTKSLHIVETPDGPWYVRPAAVDAVEVDGLDEG